MSDRTLRVAAFLLAMAALFGWVASIAKADDRACYDCLTRGADWSADKAKGDIITCQPAGSPWGKKELDEKKYKLVTVCDMTKEEATALSAHETDANRLRFTAVVVDERPIIADKATSLAVTPADAKALVDMETKSASAWALPEEPK